MALNETAMTESFVMSNVSPQNPSFNRGKWKSLESTVRNIAAIIDTTYIATGGVLTDIDQSIGANNVSFPKMYYKVRYSPRRKVMLAYIVANEKMVQPLSAYQTTVEEVEKITGYDFFYTISEAQQSITERTIEDLELLFNK